jgi:hypothetical protein
LGNSIAIFTGNTRFSRIICAVGYTAGHQQIQAAKGLDASIPILMNSRDIKEGDELLYEMPKEEKDVRKRPLVHQEKDKKKSKKEKL